METYDEKSVLPMLNGTLPTINQDGVIASVSHSGQIMIEHSPENVKDPQETSFLPIFTPDFDTKEREKEQSSNHSEGYSSIDVLKTKVARSDELSGEIVSVVTVLDPDRKDYQWNSFVNFALVVFQSEGMIDCAASQKYPMSVFG